MTLKVDNSDRRQFGRRHTNLTGRVKLAGRAAQHCVVKNLSDGGALLEFDRSEPIPFGFLLTIDGEEKIYGCEVRHHYGARVGVAFVDVALITAAVQSAYDDERAGWIKPGGTASFR